MSRSAKGSHYNEDLPAAMPSLMRTFQIDPFGFHKLSQSRMIVHGHTRSLGEFSDTSITRHTENLNRFL